jgi:hypothetical protein
VLCLLSNEGDTNKRIVNSSSLVSEEKGGIQFEATLREGKT